MFTRTEINVIVLSGDVIVRRVGGEDHVAKHFQHALLGRKPL